MEKQTNQDAKEQEIDLLELFGKLWIQKKKIVKRWDMRHLSDW